MIKVKRTYLFNLHSHSRFSANDALPAVSDMVQTVAGYGQPALGLTDHGNMAGSVQLYKHARNAGIKPFPGTELYVVANRADKKAKRHHMCVVAYTTEGYKNLVHLNTLANKNFYHKPLIDHNDLALLSDEGRLQGIAATSGCYFGFIAQAIVNDDEPRAVQLMKAYDKWFDQFYVELQNHNIDHGDGWNDDKLADRLADLAQYHGIPAVLTQDSHYCHEDDKPIHETLKRLVSFGPDADDAVFPGDGFHLADRQWFTDHHDPKRFAYGEQGLKHLLDSHDLTIPQLEKYSYNIPFTTINPLKSLKRRCIDEFAERNLSDRYMDRLLHELKIVEDTGMAGYLLLVADVTDWCKENHVFYQARGSASGSILCWLLNITQADPLKHGLRFERFISRDRTKPPDIDLDVEHTRRTELIQWLETKFAVHQIGTWLSHSLSGDEDTGKGSLRVKYYSKSRNAGNPITDWNQVPADDKRQLYALSEYGACSSYGTHAAGLVVTTNQKEFEELVPMMKVASSGTYVTQYDMGDVESLGLVKLDVLGLKTLSVLHKCFDFMGRDVFDGMDWIPLSDKPTYSMITKGETDGVFQLEGWSARNGVKELKPTKLGDIIASMALFRKATLNSGATASYIKRRHKKEEIPHRHEVLQRTVKDTYGIVVYQEQVISILRDLGMDPDSLTSFLKAVKASNSTVGDAASVIAGYRESIRDMAGSHGINDEDFAWLWGAIEGFAEYGFNKCASGRVVIYVDRLDSMAFTSETQMHKAGASQYSGTAMSLQEFYDTFYGPPTPLRSKYRAKAKGLRIAAHSNGRITTDRVVDVVFTGKQPVYELTLESGHKIQATVNHRHLTKRGWVEQFDIEPGVDEVATMGEYEHFATPTGGTPSRFNGRKAAYSELPMHCEFCGKEEGRLEIAHLNHDKQDNRRENLKRLCNSCHKQWDWDHGARKRRWSKGRPIVWSKVVSIEYVGEENTFDIEMEGEDHSWVGNGIVTHNSHATAYGLTAYRCAYLACHHTVPFFAALLSIAAGTDKEEMYVKATRAKGISIRRADVNISDASYTVNPNGKSIRKGLLAIKRVGPKAAKAIISNRPEGGYKSMTEFCQILGTRISGVKPFIESGDKEVGVFAALYNAGAFGSLDE